ncbi:transmembrane efflux protein [Streptomyces sp. SPB78]|nr:transmembrane efflux protein [Streptomyces sp. SPB78]
MRARPVPPREISRAGPVRPRAARPEDPHHPQLPEHLAHPTGQGVGPLRADIC